MDAGAIWGILGIVGTAIFGIWAINDARKQVRKSVELQRNLAWVRVQNDLVWEFINPTDKAFSREIAKGMEEFALFSKEIDSRKKPEVLKEAAEKEALLFAEKLVTDGYATWKDDLDTQKVRELLQEWRAQKNAVRVQNLLEPKRK
jgi:Mg/Co/Ni transporter MgtE